MDSKDIQSIIDRKVSKALRKWKREKGYCGTGTIGTMAGEMDLHQGQLSAYCIGHLGMSFYKYRKRLRICEAVRILRFHPRMNLIELGKAVGYGDKANFRRDFRSVTGYTPNEWKSRPLWFIRSCPDRPPRPFPDTPELPKDLLY